MLATTFAAPPFGINSGKNGDACVGTPTEGSLCLCPRKTVCATEWHEVVFLAFARASAYFDYPMYLLLFVSKCHNLRGAMYRTHLKEILPLSDVHHLHVFAGAVVSVEVIWHSFWHFARWASGGDARFLVDTQTGVTGVIALLVTPLICYPMMFHRARRAISFEYRKAMHYLAVVWGVCVMLHAPATNVLWVMGSAVGLYVADWAVGYFLKVRYCPTMTMIRLGPKAVEIVFENPRGFLPNLSGGGYVYLCLPWIGSFQWHAFSVYEHPTLKNHSSVCVLKAGDWTTALHAALTKPSNKPGWVYGPFPSPFLTASNHENIIAVASGIGITPTLGTVVSLGGTRRVNVVWTCRDAELIEYALRTVAFSKEAFTVIYYTGEHELLLDEGPFRENHNLLVIAGRPNLEKIILEIMRSVETKKPLSVHTLEAANQMYVKTFTRDGGELLEVLLKRIRLSYSVSELFELARAASLEAEIEARDAKAEARSSSLDHPASLQAAAPRPRLRTTSATISGLIQQCIVGITLRGLDKFIRDAQRGAGLGRPGHGGVDVRSYGTTLKMVFEQHDANSSGELDESQFARVLSTLSSSGEADVEASRERGGGGHRAPVYRRALVRAAASLESILTAKYEGPNFENFQARSFSSRRSPHDPVRAVHADPRGLFPAARVSLRPGSLAGFNPEALRRLPFNSIHLTPFNSAPTSFRTMERPSSDFVLRRRRDRGEDVEGHAEDHGRGRADRIFRVVIYDIYCRKDLF